MSKDSSSANLTCHLNNIAIDTTVFFWYAKTSSIDHKAHEILSQDIFPDSNQTSTDGVEILKDPMRYRYDDD
jgi:hypothetical protein